MVMEKRFKVWLAFMMVAAFTLGMAGGVVAQPKKGGVMIEAMNTEPTNLDIFKALRQPEYIVLRLMFEPLFVFNDKLEVVPHLAESYQISPDAMSWTLALKKGIKFHDGTPFNAEAAKFSLEKLMAGTQGRTLKMIDKVEVLNEYTVVIKLKQPYPLLSHTLASYNVGMVSPTAFNKAGGDWGSKVIVGTGPFMFKEWRSGDRVVLERNPEYKHGPSFLANRGPAYVDQWVIRFLREQATLMAELTAGNVDLSVYVSERDLDRVKNNPNTELLVSPSTSAIYLAINTSKKNPPYDDLRVRKALVHAVDTAAVRKAALSDVGNPLYTTISPTVLGFAPESAARGKADVVYDLAKAKALLEEAGWKDSGKGYREKDGQPLDLVFMAFSIARYKRMAEVATPMLEAAGFKVDLKILEAGDLYARLLREEHDLLATGLVASQGLAVDDLVGTFHTSSLGAAIQWCRYDNPEVDKTLDLARFDKDPKVREENLKKAQMLITADLPVVPIAQAMDILGYKKTVGGVSDWTKHPWALDQVNVYRGLLLYKK
jgi:peptide/nickel transport system substrate-binding protein